MLGFITRYLAKRAQFRQCFGHEIVRARETSNSTATFPCWLRVSTFLLQDMHRFNSQWPKKQLSNSFVFMLSVEHFAHASPIPAAIVVDLADLEFYHFGIILPNPFRNMYELHVAGAVLTRFDIAPGMITEATPYGLHCIRVYSKRARQRQKLVAPGHLSATTFLRDDGITSNLFPQTLPVGR